MTAPLYFVPVGELAEVQIEGLVTVEGAEGRHAADVARAAPGEAILLADDTGVLVHGTVTEVARGRVTVRVDHLSAHPIAQPRLVLVQALAKGDRDVHAIEMATELGVDEVVPWQADRSIVRWRGERAVKGHRKWGQTVHAAAKQSRRSRVPVVGELVDRRGLIERITAAAGALILDESAEVALAGLADQATFDVPGDLLVVVGPEGGIHPDELADFVAAGATPVRLGGGVLRTSTAGAAALSVWSARERWR